MTIDEIREKFMIPVPLFFINKNEFVGSKGDFRYKIIPDNKEKTLTAIVWYGVWCLEKSEIAAQSVFPMDETDITGYEDMCRWINEQYNVFCDSLSSKENN